MPRNVGVNKRITLIGDGADVCGCRSSGGGGEEGSGGCAGNMHSGLWWVRVSIRGVVVAG
jgi:hypothetical protein